MTFFYFCVTLFVLSLNLFFCLLEIGLLRRRPWPRFLAAGIMTWTLLMTGIFLLQAFAPVEWRGFLRRWFYLPIAVEMVWNVLFLQALVLGAILVTLLLRWLRPVRASDPPPSPADLSRRKFIYLLAGGAAPAAALGMGVHGSLTRYDLRVRTFTIPLANLPPELEGFTIAHVSDLHSGIFCGPRRLEIIRAATNDLNADLIAITGDIINNNMAEFPDALAAMRPLRSRYGLFLCEGNHDVLPGPGILARACLENRLPFLYNQTAIVTVEGRRLLLGGLPWLGRHFDGGPEWVERLYPERREGDVRILLAHHPHLFDLAGSTDLVLAGHTHGGQIMAGPVGLGPLFFRYWSGLYRRGHTTMIVSNGAGDWFPCRIGAPAEIGLLRLTRA
jgi:predicted MPP superfamily phosphohydrolase